MKKVLRILSVLFVIAVLFTASIPALAGPPENASGTWCYLPRLDEFLVTKIAGGNTFVTFGEDADWTGTFTGESYDHGSAVIHRSGSWNFKGTVSFASVTVDNETGSLEMMVIGSRPDTTTDWKGRWVLSGGDLYQAGLQGQGDWWGPGWQEIPGVCGELEYSGKYHFEP